MGPEDQGVEDCNPSSHRISLWFLNGKSEIGAKNNGGKK